MKTRISVSDSLNDFLDVWFWISVLGMKGNKFWTQMITQLSYGSFIFRNRYFSSKLVHITTSLYNMAVLTVRTFGKPLNAKVHWILQTWSSRIALRANDWAKWKQFSTLSECQSGPSLVHVHIEHGLTRLAHTWLGNHYNLNNGLKM